MLLNKGPYLWLEIRVVLADNSNQYASRIQYPQYLPTEAFYVGSDLEVLNAHITNDTMPHCIIKVNEHALDFLVAP